MEVGKFMSKYFENHIGLTFFLVVWVTTPLLFIFVHYLTIPAMPWHKCWYILYPIQIASSIAFGLIGLITDHHNRYQLKRDFLKKLES